MENTHPWSRQTEKKFLGKDFADEIFPTIDEDRFSVLYCEKDSRPNTPVNVIIGALTIKELFDYSYDEMVENLMLDLHPQYALHTTSFEEIRLLSRMESIYTCISKVCVYLDKNNPEMLTYVLRPYAAPDDFNRTFYHQRNEVLEKNVQKLINDSEELFKVYGSDFIDITERVWAKAYKYNLYK